MRKGRKLLTICVVTLIMSMLLQSYVYASTMPEMMGAKEVVQTSEYNSQKEARVTGSPKGRLISSVDLGITDEGNGVVGVYADMLCHEPMKSMKIWIYLEQWDEVAEDWEEVDLQKFEWYAVDYPEQDLTMATVSYNVPGQDRGEYYRLRAIYGVHILDDSMNEAWTASTPGLYLE